MPNYDEIRQLFAAHGQEHVFAEWNSLLPEQKEELLDNCAKVDFDWLGARWREYSESTHTSHGREIEPAPVVELSKTATGEAKHKQACEAGETLLRQGKAAAFLVAGGQGTRLGFSGPKGSYPIGPISQRTLFQWHAEQIAARARRYGTSIPWYIMTSRENDQDTRDFFLTHDFFGLSPNDVFFFQQEMVPCLDFNGKLMLSSPFTLATNPNGHGGSLSGLFRSGALDDMRRRGIEVISYFQVDNPLVTICDPVFLGWHALSGSEMSSKVLEKNSPEERIGVVCIQDGKPAVVEYIDMDKESQEAKGPDGRLKFWAGSIAIHVINVSFVERVSHGGGLPWHQSRKKVAYYDGKQMVKPQKENAVKFETFVFDALPFAEKTLNLEVKREHEFAPVKNATGEDSAVTCRALLTDYFLEWLAACGVTPQPGAFKNDGAKPVVEISPLYSLDAEELAGKVKSDGVRLEKSLLLG